MPRLRLTDARVKALKPRNAARDIRDADLRGFGVRVLPSGRKCFFVHCQHRGERVWKIVGDAAAMSVADARSGATEMLAAIRRGENPEPGESLFEDFVETVFERHARVWKTGTLAVNRGYLKNQLLPHFSGRPVAEIDRPEVVAWFAALRATPAAAIRLLLLTGCRKGEILTLRWSDYREGHLFLRDSKMGPFFPSGPVRALRGHTVPNRLY